MADLVTQLILMRQIRGLSQRQLSEKADIKQTSISGYERRKIKPSEPVLVRWAEALDCELLLVPKEKDAEPLGVST